jgi:hypothetical protein
MKRITFLLTVVCLSLASGAVVAEKAAEWPNSPKGLNPDAMQELRDAGVDKYLGQFTPNPPVDVGDGWTKHTFDSMFGAGPICIAGTDYSVFSRAGNPSRLLIFEQGGGACWENFYNCTPVVEDGRQEPPTARVGIWDFDSKDNPFADYSILYMPYCDGSVFTGDNDVFDPLWQAFIEGAFGLPPGAGPPFRFHRGLRNQSAGMDLAKAMFPHASRITVAGSSAGGVGVAGFAPFLVRMLYGNQVKLTVFNDAGPVTSNLDAVDEVAARAADWQFGQFFPNSCTDCDDMGQSTAIIRWRLDNDSTVREAYYETDGDLTNRFFLNLLGDPVAFRNLVVTEHGLLNAAHPERYKRFIVAGDTSHTALQTPLFYTQHANGVLLNEWVEDFVVPRPFWEDIVEDPIP